MSHTRRKFDPECLWVPETVSGLVMRLFDIR